MPARVALQRPSERVPQDPGGLEFSEQSGQGRLEFGVTIRLEQKRPAIVALRQLVARQPRAEQERDMAIGQYIGDVKGPATVQGHIQDSAGEGGRPRRGQRLLSGAADENLLRTGLFEQQVLEHHREQALVLEDENHLQGAPATGGGFLILKMEHDPVIDRPGVSVEGKRSEANGAATALPFNGSLTHIRNQMSKWRIWR